MAKKILEVHELTTKYITRQGEDVYSVDHVSLDIEEKINNWYKAILLLLPLTNFLEKLIS